MLLFQDGHRCKKNQRPSQDHHSHPGQGQEIIHYRGPRSKEEGTIFGVVGKLVPFRTGTD